MRRMVLITSDAWKVKMSSIFVLYPLPWLLQRLNFVSWILRCFKGISKSAKQLLLRYIPVIKLKIGNLLMWTLWLKAHHAVDEPAWGWYDLSWICAQTPCKGGPHWSSLHSNLHHMWKGIPRISILPTHSLIIHPSDRPMAWTTLPLIHSTP